MRNESGKNPYDELDRYDEDDLLVDEAPTHVPTVSSAYAPPASPPAISRTNAAPTYVPSPITTPPVPAQPPVPSPSQSWWRQPTWLWPKKSPPEPQFERPTAEPSALGPSGEPGQYIENPADGSLIFVPAPSQARTSAWWKKQPYYAISHLAAMSGTLAVAWLFGILAAQILPGNITNPPIQETALRKSSRLAGRLWHFRQLWQTPTAETRIEAIPLPNVEPVTQPVNLSPIERQPLIDELNAIETEILTLDRRIETLEAQLGRPPYEGADIDNRLNSLRAAIDPPVRSPTEPKYKPTPTDPANALLEVAKLKITLPSDALFTPGQSDLKANQMLNQVLDQLVNYPQATVVIRSYSDDQAKPLAARKYTMAQAAALSDYFKRSLPKGYRWVVLGGGRSQPVASNEDEIGRQKNRRIEILVDTR